MFTVIATVFLLVIHQGQCGMNATADLYSPDGEVKHGTLVFTQENADSPVRIIGSFSGLNASSAHGFHIHTFPVSEISPNCSAAGPHLNPYNTTHGPRTTSITSRHVGDLGNVTVDEDGDLKIEIEDSIIQLYNTTQSILNRTAVIHRLRDDGGQGGFIDSNTTGNAGPRIICGLIKLAWVDPTTTTTISSTTTTTMETSDTTTTVSSTSTWATSTTDTDSTMTSTTDTHSTMTSTTDTNSTMPSAAFKIQPVAFVLVITMIIDYIIRY